MQSTKSIGILYHFANEAKALLFKDRFKKIQIDIKLFSCGQFPTVPDFSKNKIDNLIILVSSNYLKSSFCLNTLISKGISFEDKNIIPILIDGIYIENVEQNFVFEKTKIESEGDINEYHKYWKSKRENLLNLIGTKSNIKGVQRQLILVNQIIKSFDRIIDFLKSNDVDGYDRMTKNNFKYLFERLDGKDLFETYKRVVGFRGNTIVNKNDYQLSKLESDEDTESKEDMELKMHSGDVGNILKETLDSFKSSKQSLKEKYEEKLITINDFYQRNDKKCVKFLKRELKSNKNEKLEGDLLSLIDDHLFDGKLYFLLGNYYENNDNFKEAYIAFGKCASLENNFDNVHFKIAVNYSKMDNFIEKQLLKYWKKASKKKPEDKIVLKSYIHLLIKLQKNKKAKKQLLRLLSIDPNNSFAEKKLIKISLKLGESIDYITKEKEENDNVIKEIEKEAEDEIPDFIKSHLKGISKEQEDINEDQILDDNSLDEDEIVDEFDEEDDDFENDGQEDLDIDEDGHKEKIDFVSDDEFEGEGIGDEMDSMSEEENIDDFEKVCFITGATSGIGEALAIKFAQFGYNIIITGRRKKRLKTLKKLIEETYDVLVLALSYDVREAYDCKMAVKEAVKKFGVIDILINNAGLAKGFDDFDKGNIDDWNIMIDTNLKGLMYMSKYVSKHMSKNGFGQIINVGSIAGKEVYPKGNLYCASKHAVVALTKAMRIDLLKYNIRVGSVNPGHVENTEFALVRFDQDAEKAKIYNDFMPLSSEDVADMVFYMCTVPSHINILDVTMTSTQQANAIIVNRDGRNKNPN